MHQFTHQIVAMARAGLVRSCEPGIFFRSPMWVLESQDLSRPPLLSQHIIRELDQRWNSWDLNWYKYGKLALQAEDEYALPDSPFIID